jgi:hypothetical protein
MTKYELHTDVVAIMADAFFQKQIPPIETLYRLNKYPQTDNENWSLIQSLIRYHPRLSEAIKEITTSDYVGGDESDWEDFVVGHSEGDPADPMQMMRMLTMEGHLSGDAAWRGPTVIIGDHGSGRNDMNHMAHLWKEIKDVEYLHQSINYQILKITI